MREIAITDNESFTYKTTGTEKLDVFDWLTSTPRSANFPDIVEIRFKNTRKSFFKNVNGLNLKRGDIVAVEASPGHDIGIVSLVGELVIEQIKKMGVDKNIDFKKVYRKAKPVDVEKWKQALDLETPIMLKAREIALSLNLNMKIGDVEFQGDKTKAIFYYIADERVDFRELIKVLADEFRIRVEMRQIGARQEAGRIGGISSCGRELCCSTWITNFVSVSTNAARYQELSLNPQKLAGQCGKLKCCLNYELDSYLDCQRKFPPTNIPLQTEDGPAYHQKTDVFKGIMWYAFGHENFTNFTPVPVERIHEIIKINKSGRKVAKLIDFEDEVFVPIEAKGFDYENAVGTESITRFDRDGAKKKKHQKQKNNPRDNRPQQNDRPEKREQQERPQQNEPVERRQNNDRNDRPQSNQRNDKPQTNEGGNKPVNNQHGERPEHHQQSGKPHVHHRPNHPQRRNNPNQNNKENNHQE